MTFLVPRLYLNYYPTLIYQKNPTVSPAWAAPACACAARTGCSSCIDEAKDLQNFSATADTAKIYIASFGSEEKVMKQYANMLNQRLKMHPTIASAQKRKHTVWCSWYSYYEKISEQQMMKDLVDLRGTKADVFQIDDGWQTKVGDWDVNAKFPSGMPQLSQSIHKEGRSAVTG